jgi:hypothetical protein
MDETERRILIQRNLPEKQLLQRVNTHLQQREIKLFSNITYPTGIF